MARVFVSHASGDRFVAEQLHAWLKSAGNEVFLDQNVRDGLTVGDVWEQRLYERLRWADAVVCILTADFLRSSWCAAEIGIARSQGSRLMPVVAESGITHPLLSRSQYQYLDLTEDEQKAQAVLTEAMHRIDSAGGRGWPDDRSPYPGLRAFDVDLHRVFFGRRTEIAELSALLRSPAQAPAGALVVVGASGCGKSSLVRAGLIPAIADERGWSTVSPIVPGTDPVAALARQLASTSRGLGLGWSFTDVLERLHDGNDGLAVLAHELLMASPQQNQSHLLLVIDQMEELITVSQPEVASRFASLIRGGTAGPVRAVATLRPEWLGQLLSNATLADLCARTYTLRPLSHDALSLVIEGPARVAGLKIDDELLSSLVEDTGSGEALPLLAFTLAELSDGVRRGDRLSMERYEQLGRVQGTLTRQADEALAEAVSSTGQSAEVVISDLLRLVSVDATGRPTRRRITEPSLPELASAELGFFVTRRLVTTDSVDGVLTLSVAHDAFFTAWLPLAAAISKGAAALVARQTVERAADEWAEAGRAPSRLWERGQLAAVISATDAVIRRGRPPGRDPVTPARGTGRRGAPLPRPRRVLISRAVELTPVAADFLMSGLRRERLRRSRAAAVLSVLLVLAVTGATIAVIQRNGALRAEQAALAEQRVSLSRQLVAQAEAVRLDDVRTSLRLGIAADHIHSDGQTQASLVKTLTTTRYAGQIDGLTAPVYSVAYSNDGRTLATAGYQDSVVLWDVTDRGKPVQLGQPLAGTRSPAAYTRDGRTLITAGSADTMLLWDVTDPKRPIPIGRPLSDGQPVTSLAANDHIIAVGGTKGVALWDLADRDHPMLASRLSGACAPISLSPDAQILATCGPDNTVVLWDIRDLAHPVRRGAARGHAAAIAAIAYGPGRILATSSLDRTVALWDLKDAWSPVRFGPAIKDAGFVLAVDLAPNGDVMATANSDHTVALWNIVDRAHPVRMGPSLAGHSGPVDSVAFAPDSRSVASGSDDRTVMMWDVAERGHVHQLGDPLQLQTKPLFRVEFAPGGQMMATGSLDHTVVLWNLANREHPNPFGPLLKGHTGGVWTIAFSPNGRTMATSGNDETILLWDVNDPAAPTPLNRSPVKANRRGVQSVAFTPDGRTLVSGGRDGQLMLWDVTDPANPQPRGRPFGTGLGIAWSVAFSPDGRTLAAAGNRGMVLLWDVSTGTPQPLPGGTPGHTGSVLSLAFTRDSQILATASTDSTVILWNVQDPSDPKRVGSRLNGNANLASVGFSLDGKTLVTGARDGTATLWDLTDRALPQRLQEPLPGRHGTLWSVAVSPDSGILAASDNAGLVLWDLADLRDLREDPTARACSLTGHGLSHDEWSRYIPGLQPEETCP
jgi:WD40 repeat protein